MKCIDNIVYSKVHSFEVNIIKMISHVETLDEYENNYRNMDHSNI